MTLPKTPDDVRVEQVARAINPNPFRSHQSMFEYCVAQGDSEETARRYADDTHGPDMERVREQARAAIATLDRLSSTRPSDESVALDALVEQTKLLNGWLGSVAECDPDEIVADGGITAGMVVRQEAGEQQRRVRRALQCVFDARLAALSTSNSSVTAEGK